MKNLGTILAAFFVALVLVLYMCTFQVRFTEVAIVKTWGKPAEQAITEPGLKLKWPPPIQTVILYDKRLRPLEDRTEETRTVDGKNLVVTTYTLWRIADPSKFHTNFPAGVDEGEKRLRTAVIAHKQAVIGQHSFEEFVSTNPADRKLGEIEQQIQTRVAKDARDAYGIDIVDFGIKKLALPESVTAAIFESMKSHEQAKAARYQAEGEARANDILANARAARERILAAARQKVAEIEAEAQRVVSSYYKEFDRHPELRIFLDKLRTVASALQQRTTLVITTEHTPFDVFEEETRRDIAAGATGPADLTRAQAEKSRSSGAPDMTAKKPD
jgi:modulator of FtsH protease HflC